MLTQVAVAAAVAILAILIAGQVARRRLARRYPAPGRFVDIGGRHLHVIERGVDPAHADRPTVVLEGGIWASALAWDHVQREIAHFARVIAYDRAGLGWSEPAPASERRTAAAMADDLAALLAAGSIAGPYLLVGHSLGGSVVRVFALRHPDLVAGVVLLDGAHEDQMRRAPAELRTFMAAMDRRMPTLFRALGLLVRSGLLALVPRVVPTGAPRLPADLAMAVRSRIATQPSVVLAMSRESAAVEAGNDEIRAMAITSLGPIPLTVITHGRPEGVPPRFAPEVAAAYEATWQELQAAQAGLSPLGRRMVATGVGHDIPGDGPRYVVDAVREMLDGIGSAARVVA